LFGQRTARETLRSRRGAHISHKAMSANTPAKQARRMAGSLAMNANMAIYK
jgi:hypothetical protein